MMRGRDGHLPRMPANAHMRHQARIFSNNPIKAEGFAM